MYVSKTCISSYRCFYIYMLISTFICPILLSITICYTAKNEQDTLKRGLFLIKIIDHISFVMFGPMLQK